MVMGGCCELFCSSRSGLTKRTKYCGGIGELVGILWELVFFAFSFLSLFIYALRAVRVGGDPGFAGRN
jgi:hypothetical protein